MPRGRSISLSEYELEQSANDNAHLPFKQYTYTVVKDAAIVRKNSAPSSPLDFYYAHHEYPYAPTAISSDSQSTLGSIESVGSAGVGEGVPVNGYNDVWKPTSFPPECLSPHTPKQYCEYCFSFYARQCYSAYKPLPHVTDNGPWNEHLCKDIMGRITCPLLSVHVCIGCGGVGPNVHKGTDCPLAASVTSPSPLDILTADGESVSGSPVGAIGDRFTF